MSRSWREAKWIQTKETTALFVELGEIIQAKVGLKLKEVRAEGWVTNLRLAIQRFKCVLLDYEQKAMQ